MRILVVNPNTTASMTARIGAAARAAAFPGTDILAVNPAMGPASIEGYYDEALAVPGLLEEILRHQGGPNGIDGAGIDGAGIDGTVIACFDDVGLDAARSVAIGPVVGICEAAMQTAGLLGGRFAVVTTLHRSVPALERLAERYGVAGRCRIRAAGVPVLALEDPGSGAVERVRAEIRRAVDEDGAESIVLGCAGMADLARALGQETGVPVVDGVSAAVKLVEGLVSLGLRTSKAGGYAAPLPKAYAGELARFAPPAVE
ncbi:aspartate/glutamate racemase family protein [Azospirillum agricola]|uniref:aspartate/glutamate racemase family protein n=1 Tax=Azospirillum agricola TaxID=1720247 RepID=UPI000A0F02A4|nr:aspartate/glutamate racemase family protein [Azospirillum agricola]SMH38108.1 allantoin racemase [Azospirillum lipoferum]